MTARVRKLIWALLLMTAVHSNADDHAAIEAPLAREFARSVNMRLDVPTSAQQAYAQRLQRTLAAVGYAELAPQYVLLVDRSASVQALFIYWRSPDHDWRFVGASPVSTGRPGTFDHFVTPTGVFPHTVDNMDFRAEGTRNDLGIRYGVKGMRVYDFGWVTGNAAGVTEARPPCACRCMRRTPICSNRDSASVTRKAAFAFRLR